MKSALITGASTGIGRATALHLEAKGRRVFAGVRKEADAESLREAGSERLIPLMLDVIDAGQIAAAAERVTAEMGEAGLEKWGRPASTAWSTTPGSPFPVHWRRCR